jgi:hypothetical protein
VPSSHVLQIINILNSTVLEYMNGARVNIKSPDNILFKNSICSQVLVAHAYNPSYSGGRDQEGLSSRPAWACSLRGPILKISNTKQGYWELLASGLHYTSLVVAFPF